jgi:hypothetical protein
MTKHLTFPLFVTFSRALLKSIRHAFILKFLFGLEMCKREPRSKPRNLEKTLKIPYNFFSWFESRGDPRPPHFC